MTRLTMRTLIVAAMLAMPACAADVDAPAGSPPQPAPAAISQPDDQAEDALTVKAFQARMAELEAKMPSQLSLALCALGGVLLAAMIGAVGLIVVTELQHKHKRKREVERQRIELFARLTGLRAAICSAYQLPGQALALQRLCGARVRTSSTNAQLYRDAVDAWRTKRERWVGDAIELQTQLGEAIGQVLAVFEPSEETRRLVADALAAVALPDLDFSESTESDPRWLDMAMINAARDIVVRQIRQHCHVPLTTLLNNLATQLPGKGSRSLPASTMRVPQPITSEMIAEHMAKAGPSGAKAADADTSAPEEPTSSENSDDTPPDTG